MKNLSSGVAFGMDQIEQLTQRGFKGYSRRPSLHKLKRRQENPWGGGLFPRRNRRGCKKNQKRERNFSGLCRTIDKGVRIQYTWLKKPNSKLIDPGNGRARVVLLLFVIEAGE